MSAMLELLSRRRSIPAARLSAPGPSTEQVERLITIAARVPDHAKLAPWRFVVYPTAAGAEIGAWLTERMKVVKPDAPEGQVALTAARFSTAPLVVGVIHRPRPNHPKAPEWEQHLTVGAACMNLIIAAHAMGFAANWITEWYAYDDEAAAYLGAAEGERFAGFIHIGTPLDPPQERDRPALADILTTWGA
jgi:nitroreductase